MSTTISNLAEKREAMISDFVSASSQCSYDIPETYVEAPRKTTNSRRLLPALPSFHAIALIMGFFDYSKGVESLLEQLSTKTREHWRSHHAILKGFIVTWRP